MAAVYCLLDSQLCISAEAWAGWAQAFGAVVAILVAFSIGRRDHRQRLRDANDTKAAQRRVVCFALQRAALLTHQFGANQDAAAVQAFFLDTPDSAFVDVYEALASVPIHGLHATEIEAYFEARAAFVEVVRRVQRLYGHLQTNIDIGLLPPTRGTVVYGKIDRAIKLLM